MNGALLHSLIRLDVRIRRLAVLALLMLIVAECWLLWLRAPLQEYRQLLGAQADTERAMRSTAALPADLPRLHAEVAALEQQLNQDQQDDLSEGRQAAALMGRLDQIALRHHVELASVKPGSSSQVRGFVSSSEDVEANGRYGDLMAWLREVERELGPLVVTNFSLASRAADDPLLHIALHLTAFHASAHTGTEP